MSGAPNAAFRGVRDLADGLDSAAPGFPRAHGQLQREQRHMKLAVKVVPGSSQDRIAGWLGDELKIRVRQAPENGKANDAVRRLLSKTLALPLDRIRIVSGATSPHKTIEIIGVDATAFNARLSL